LGPGPISPALKMLIGANAVMFFLQLVPGVTSVLALQPVRVVRGLQLWQLGTYMFLHAGLFHIIFNMLALWMFGAELERKWGTRFFLRFYFVTGVGAALMTVAFSLLPFGVAQQLYRSAVIGASGAIFGLLLAYALYFPDRPIYMYFLFPIAARTFVLIMGAIALYTSISEAGGVAGATHLGGLAVGYVYLRGFRARPLAELKYQYWKWKTNRARKRFDVYSGGRRNDWNRHVH
jgi:membrane associated rhomboid family serine protease